MFEWFVDILRSYPPLALFLTIGLGFLVGRIRVGNFQLGSVTSVLIVGVIIGQLNIPMSGPIKAFFFMLFLFSIGYSVGPDFFKSLKGSGAKQALFAVCMSSICFLTTLAISYIFSYSKGETVGLFSGSQTCSALLGVGSEAIQKLGYPDDVLARELGIIPICYAVTYIFGTLGTVLLLGNFGPKLLGGIDYVRAKTAELEMQLGKLSSHEDPAIINSKGKVSYRTYRIDNPFFDDPKTVAETEKYLRKQGLGVYIDCHSHKGEVSTSKYDNLLHSGDHVVICGRDTYLHSCPWRGPDFSGFLHPCHRLYRHIRRQQHSSCHLGTADSNSCELVVN